MNCTGINPINFEGNTPIDPTEFWNFEVYECVASSTATTSMVSPIMDYGDVLTITILGFMALTLLTAILADRVYGVKQQNTDRYL